MSKQSDWKSVLKAQHDDLQRLEDMNSALNEEQILKNVDQTIRKATSTSSSSFNANSSSSSSSSSSAIKRTTIIDNTDSRSSRNEKKSLDLSFGSDDSQIYAGRSSSASGSTRDRPRSGNNTKIISRDTMSIDGLSSPNSTAASGGGGLTPREPNANLRYLKAREKMLSKQVDDANELRKNMNEQVSDLQKQLKSEKEENKMLKKRIQILEVDNRKTVSKRSSTNSASDGTTDGNTTDALTQEISILKKDLLTAERIAKQTDSTNKAKDTQLKRAVETITRLKAQVAELQQQNDGSYHTDRSKLDAAEAKIRVLEKQKSDLMVAFKKQMKLIDVLKRQKVHIEASRLLNFTEEEFMKTLDWCTV